MEAVSMICVTIAGICRLIFAAMAAAIVVFAGSAVS